VTGVHVDLGLPTVGPAPAGAARPQSYRVDVAGGYSVRVLDLGLACCAVEFVAALAAFPDVLRPEGDEAHADTAPATVAVMVVSGTVTDKMAPAVRRAYERLPDPRLVVSFGSCANSGGPYWDSYCVTKGVDQVVPVDLYVPGCPPRPEALVQALRALDGCSSR
jgi:NADH-quinone oxidoreductase subunit B